MQNFKLEHILEHGFTKLVFNPDLIEIVKNEDSLEDNLKYNCESYARKSISFIYKDESLDAVNNFYGYFPNLNKRVEYSRVKKALVYYITKKVKMRKKPNVNQYTDKTVKEFNEIDLMPRIELVHDLFREYFDALNIEIESTIKRKILDSYGKLNAYQFNENKMLKDLQSEIDKMQEKIKELKDARHELKKNLSINFIESTTEINLDYKKDLIDSIKKEMRKERFF